MHAIMADPRYAQAIETTADLLRRLRLDSIFVGDIARVAWLGGRVEGGSVDVIAVMKPEQKNQLAMMASNRGFRVEREQIEATEELDLVPLNFIHESGDVRVHVLLASNALYAHMVKAGIDAAMGELALRVPAAEDLALLLAVSDEEKTRRDFDALIRLPQFDRRAYNERLVAIGLPQFAISE